MAKTSAKGAPNMKTTRIGVSSTQGRATIFRSGSDIVINITRLARRDDSWLVNARDHAGQQGKAARLQMVLDGQEGTAGDVAEYLRVIETFAD
jgi:hypothetical protein